MNLFDSSFLCLDIGTSGVRGIAHRVRGANIVKSAFFTVENTDTVYAINSVVDELEKQLGVHFDSAYVTGNFGASYFDRVLKNTVWSGEHKISASDIRSQIAQISSPDDFFPIHIIPLRYYSPSSRNVSMPVGHVDTQLISLFGVICYSRSGVDSVYQILRGAHVQPDAFFDPQFLHNAIYRPDKQTVMFIDFGAEYTSASIWTARGPVWHTKIKSGGSDITNVIVNQFGLDFLAADQIKRSVASMIPKEMDRFTPADTLYDFSRSDINDIVVPMLLNIISELKNQSTDAFAKFKPTQIFISGGGSEIEGLRDLIENSFAVMTTIMPSDASVRALSDYVWHAEEGHRKSYIARHEKWRRRTNWFGFLFNRRPKVRQTLIPIMPSTLCFDMMRSDTYTMFKSGGISVIHVDIMDGFYVDNVAGSIDMLRVIRGHTKAHLHVHLMTESPNVWAADAVAAGADTVILSPNTSGVRAAIKNVRASGRRVGVALNPETPVSVLKPVLRDLDEVLIMSVAPGAAGQSFEPTSLHKISVLAATRKKYGLKFIISVDGGINDKTAQLCWAAGADMLVSGSYLARASDFPLAVQSLLPRPE